MPESTLHFPYTDPAQQREASSLGMWIFLGTEVMLFGTLFTVFTYFHSLYPGAFTAASRQTDFWLGTANTAVLLISSLTMALGVLSAKRGENGAVVRYLFLTMLLGAVFLGLKGLEYSHHIHDHLFPGPGFHFDAPDQKAVELYFYLYFAMTGLHALHMIGGIVLLAVLVGFTWRGRYSRAYHSPVELAGLYWHLVDIVWIFLFPMFYLIGRR